MSLIKNYNKMKLDNNCKKNLLKFFENVFKYLALLFFLKFFYKIFYMVIFNKKNCIKA